RLGLGRDSMPERFLQRATNPSQSHSRSKFADASGGTRLRSGVSLGHEVEEMDNEVPVVSGCAGERGGTKSPRAVDKTRGCIAGVPDAIVPLHRVEHPGDFRFLPLHSGRGEKPDESRMSGWVDQARKPGEHEGSFGVGDVAENFFAVSFARADQVENVIANLEGRAEEKSERI